MFDEQISRKPDRYPWTEDFITAMHNGFWTDKEFNFQSDIQDFKVNMSEEEKEVIKNTLSAIGQIEVAVKKFWAKLGDNLPHPSLVDLGYVMANVEVIHNNAYERLLKVLDMEDVFEENLKNNVIIGRVNYLRKYLHKYYTDSKKQYIYSLILFTLFIENVSLFSQFYVVLWFGRYKNMLKDTNQQVSYTRAEENLHAEAGIKIINTLKKEYPDLFDKDLEDKILHESEEAFKAESKMIDWMIGDYKGERISADILKEYVKSRINDSLSAIGYKKIFDINPTLARDFEWMDEEVLGNNMTDFFYKRPTEYSRNTHAFTAESLF
jgi:ribonucleoside-diphosphate reductase beta chain